MARIVEYSEVPLVSSDIIGNPHFVDLRRAVSRGLRTTGTPNVVAWYDNEWGYLEPGAVDLIERLAVAGAIDGSGSQSSRPSLPSSSAAKDLAVPSLVLALTVAHVLLPGRGGHFFQEVGDGFADVFHGDVVVGLFPEGLPSAERITRPWAVEAELLDDLLVLGEWSRRGSAP